MIHNPKRYLPGAAKKTPAGDMCTQNPLPPPIFNIEGAFVDRPGCAKTGVFFAASGALRAMSILKLGVKGGRARVHPLLGAGVFFAAPGIGSVVFDTCMRHE